MDDSQREILKLARELYDIGYKVGKTKREVTPEITDAEVERAAQILANERFRRRYGYYPRGYPAEIQLEDRDLADRALAAAREGSDLRAKAADWAARGGE